MLPPILTYGGIDEAGRGPLAGPVVAACVVRTTFYIHGITDSKKLSEKKREFLYDQIMKHWYVGIGIVSNVDVDDYGIKKTTMMAMQEAIDNLSIIPKKVHVDGNDKFNFSIPHISIIRGDQTDILIGAASIVAKVTRDRYMKEMRISYPEYYFEKHKGYGTKVHYDQLKKYGLSPLHRKTFLKKITDS